MAVCSLANSRLPLPGKLASPVDRSPSGMRISKPSGYSEEHSAKNTEIPSRPHGVLSKTTSKPQNYQQKVENGFLLGTSNKHNCILENNLVFSG